MVTSHDCFVCNRNLLIERILQSKVVTIVLGLGTGAGGGIVPMVVVIAVSDVPIMPTGVPIHLEPRRVLQKAQTVGRMGRVQTRQALVRVDIFQQHGEIQSPRSTTTRSMKICDNIF